MTAVIVKSGQWKCLNGENPVNGKCCVWKEDVPLIQTTVSVANCAGGGCQ